MLLKKSIIEMREDEVFNAEINNQEYTEFITKICQAHTKIKNLVPNDKQGELYMLMTELEDAIGQSSLIELKGMYQQGFNDGLEIAARLLKVKI